MVFFQHPFISLIDDPKIVTQFFFETRKKELFLIPRKIFCAFDDLIHDDSVDKIFDKEFDGSSSRGIYRCSKVDFGKFHGNNQCGCKEIVIIRMIATLQKKLNRNKELVIKSKASRVDELDQFHHNLV